MLPATRRPQTRPARVPGTRSPLGRAGLRPEAVVLRADGAVLLRVLAAADAAAPTAYRAPELDDEPDPARRRMNSQ